MISGKVCGLVFVDYFGERHVRMAPKEREKNSWSPSQQVHRKPFSDIQAFWGQYDGRQIQRIWKLTAQKMHVINPILKACFNFLNKALKPISRLITCLIRMFSNVLD